MTAYVIDARRTLRIATAVLDTFGTYRTRRGVEAGGILLGRIYETRVVVEVATPPTPSDKAGPYFFERSRTVAQAAVNRAWAATSGERMYLGEWHSHPADVAEPSSRDRTMILNMLRETKMEISFLFLVVLGRKEDWVGVAQNGTVRRLHAVADRKIVAPPKAGGRRSRDPAPERTVRRAQTGICHWARRVLACFHVTRNG